ncbi:MAG: glycosyltransferase family 87 protein [Phycisphaerae bacterium]|nr:glycosyltransferase family 87 protein [Phycisphaerae bacterium]
MTERSDEQRPLDPFAVSRRLLIVGVLVACAVISWSRASRVTYDFHHFYLDAAYVWEHGALNPTLNDPQPLNNRQLPFYLPTVSVLLAPLAAGGRGVAAVLWTIVQMLSLSYCMWALARWCRMRESGNLGAVRFGWLVVLSLAALYEASKFNQVSFLTLALILAGVSALETRREFAGGCWLAAAAVLKLLPAAFAVWLALQRRWRALAGFVVGCGLLIALPPLVAFGPQRAVQYHQEWWRFNIGSAGLRAWLEVDNPGPFSAHFVDRRNQSIAATLARLTVADHPRPAFWQPVHLSVEQVGRIAGWVSGALLLLMFSAVARRPSIADPLWSVRCDAALLTIGIQVLAPLTRMYYLVWTMPALAILLIAASPPSGATSRSVLLGRIGLIAWLLGMGAWLSRDLRDLGAHAIMLVVIGTCVALLRSRRDTAAP